MNVLISIRLQNKPEPIFFMADPKDEYLLDKEEEMVVDDRNKEKTELKQLVQLH